MTPGEIQDSDGDTYPADERDAAWAWPEATLLCHISVATAPLAAVTPAGALGPPTRLYSDRRLVYPTPWLNATGDLAQAEHTRQIERRLMQGLLTRIYDDDAWPVGAPRVVWLRVAHREWVKWVAPHRVAAPRPATTEEATR